MATTAILPKGRTACSRDRSAQAKKKNQMQEKFEFKGDWETKIILKDFSQLNHSDYKRYDQDVEKGIFNMTIEDEQNCNPFPEKEQLNAIDYLISNQELILNSVFNYAVNSVYPAYKEFQSPSEYPECYPELNSREDLQKLLGINEILITRYKKGDFAYIVLGFNTCLDYEHGLYIIYHQDRPLADAPMGDLSYEKIFEEGGNAKYDESYKKYGDSPSKFGLHIPDPMLGKLKPWQGEVSERRINEIVKNEPELLIKLIDEKIVSGNTKLNYNSVFELCVKNRNFELIEYLINNGSEFGNSLMFCVGRNFDKELLDFLVKLGADINTPVYNNESSTILFKEIRDLAQLFFHKKTDMEESKQRIKSIIQLGGDLNNCNGKGGNYIELLKRHYSESFISRMNLESIFKEL